MLYQPRLVKAAMTAAFFSSALLAQFEQGSIVGTVTDPQKAPIAGASIVIRSTTTNVSRELSTSGSGEYNSLPLTPGKYTINVKSAGFRERSIEVNSA